MGFTCARKVGSTTAIATTLDLGDVEPPLEADPDNVVCHVDVAGTAYTSTATTKTLNADGTVSVVAAIPANGGDKANDVAGKYRMDWHVTVGDVVIKVPGQGFDTLVVVADG